MAADFEGKVIIVTGAASGIGQATALAFARHKAWLVLADISEDALADTKRQAEALGARVVSLKVDVSKPEQCVAMVALAEQTFGRLDAAFNNAGITDGPAPPESHEYSIDLWKRMIDIDLSGVFYCIRAELPALLRAGGGAIVNTSSIQFVKSFPRTPAYTAAKHGIVGLTKVICNEYADRKIRCNAIAPGVAATPNSSIILNDPAWRDALESSIPAGRVASADEIAEAVMWLCSDASRYVNGVCLPVDGGLLTR